MAIAAVLFLPGLSADILFDNRKNSIYPEAGSYANLVFRQNLKALGSDGNWESLLIDVRKYIRLNDHTQNILAFWSYNWLTLSGNPPYMDLPQHGLGHLWQYRSWICSKPLSEQGYVGPGR